MKKPLVLAVLGVTAVLIMGADDSCNTDDTGSQPAKQSNSNKPANGGSNSNSKPASSEPEMTPGQENALQAANDYLDYAPFSKAGLIDQLSSSAGDGYPVADATFAANHVDADWNEEAYKAAKSYLDYSSFSLQGLIDQWSSSAGDQFTQAQAEYGAKKAYNGG